MTDRNIEVWLVVDWKSGKTRTRKSKPSAGELGKNELLAKIDIEVVIPEVDVPELSLQIDVPEPQVYAATIEALDEDQLPDWSNVAAEVVSNNEDRLRAVDDRYDFEDLVDELTGKVLLQVETRPAPDNVWDFIEGLARDLVQDGDE